MPNLSDKARVGIITECFKHFNSNTNRIRYGGYYYVKQKYPNVGMSTIRLVFSDFLKHRKFTSLKKGKVGRKSKLTPELREQYRRIMQDYANMWIRTTTVILQKELRDAGFPLSTSTIWSHLKTMNAHRKNLRIKPSLSVAQKQARIDFILDRADRFSVQSNKKCRG
jgi:hypothetical protein